MIDIYEIASDLEYVSNLPIKSKTELLSKDFIFDYTKSVKWNREQVNKNNHKYNEELNELRSKKQAKCSEYINKCYLYISQELDINLYKAVIIWNYCYCKKHSYGYREVIDEVIDIIELIKALSKDDNVI